MKKIHRYFRSVGPGALVTAAFIGPGTLTTCINAGVESKYHLLWAVVFATFSAIVLQLTASRIGIVTQNGLGTNIINNTNNRIVQKALSFLIVFAIFVGNCAFETGNITGAVVGLQMLLPYNNLVYVLCVSMLIIVIVLFFNNIVIQKLLVTIVAIMTAVFVTLSLVSSPNWNDVFDGITKMSIDKNSSNTIMGLIGTTIGPYGLFLHANAASKQWSNTKDLQYSNFDTILSISIGGLITSCIVILAANTSIISNTSSFNSVVDLSTLLSNTWGSWMKYLYAIGIIAAGFSSALTAPIGASIVAIEMINHKNDLKGTKSKSVSLFIVLIGMFFSILFGKSPISLIIFAQVINAFILPLISILILICANSKNMGKYKNNLTQNIFGVFVIVICILIGIRNIIATIV